jgi:signal peptidase I
LFRYLIALAVVAIVAFCAAFQVVVVPTASMERTVLIGDHLLVNRVSYRFQKLRRGEVISFRAPGKKNAIFLKRVVALGGDRVEIRDGLVLVNGVAVSEPYAEHLPGAVERGDSTVTVPSDEMFVLGDNRDRSEDSRYFGPVPVRNIVGKPVMVLWSFAIPTERWMRPQQTALYLDHPLSKLRWSRFFRPVQ